MSDLRNQIRSFVSSPRDAERFAMLVAALLAAGLRVDATQSGDEVVMEVGVDRG